MNIWGNKSVKEMLPRIYVYIYYVLRIDNDLWDGSIVEEGEKCLSLLSAVVTDGEIITYKKKEFKLLFLLHDIILYIVLYLLVVVGLLLS